MEVFENSPGLGGLLLLFQPKFIVNFGAFFAQTCADVLFKIHVGPCSTAN